MQLLLPLLVVFTGLAGRALTDKIIALRGGAAAVATWAQLSSLIDLVSGVSLAGIGVALVAAVAHSGEPGRHAWLRAALLPAMLLSGLAAALAVPVMQGFGLAIVPPGQESLTLLAILAGWLAVPGGLAVSIKIGAQRPGAAAALLAASFVTPGPSSCHPLPDPCWSTCCSVKRASVPPWRFRSSSAGHIPWIGLK